MKGTNLTIGKIISLSSLEQCFHQAIIKSGTQITVRFALEQGKEIYAIPHSIFDNSFCNELIKQGAIPVLKGQDLEEFY